MLKFLINLTLVFGISCLSVSVKSQTIQNFSFTDIDGVTHNLYQNHLDQGKTVVIKFFFVACPPCRSNAPQYQNKHLEWGNNNHDTRFMELSVLTTDDNSKVSGYKNTFGMTLISAGSDGNSHLVANIFKTGQFGPWYGTPSFAVIAPDRTVQYPILFSDLDEAIERTGAEKPGGTTPDPTIIRVNAQTSITGFQDNVVKFFLKPMNSGTPKYEIIKNNNGQFTFTYPSISHPRIDNPVVIMETNAPAYHSSINSLDLIAIQRHILGTKPMTLQTQTLAADVNGDGKINSIDLINIQKVIIGSLNEFSNQVKSYKSIPEVLSVTENSGQTVELPFTIIKMGNVN